MPRRSISISLREQAADKAAAFRRSYRRSRAALEGLTADVARRGERLARELRDEIRRQLASLAGDPRDPFVARLVPSVGEEVARSLETLKRGLGGEIRQALGDAYELGGTVAPQAFVDAGVQVGFPSVSPELLRSLTATFDDVLGEVISDLGDRIMREVRLGAAALAPASQVIRRTYDMLAVSREVVRGLRKRIGFAYQAESIARTELGRAYSNAQQIAGQALSDSIPGLRKRWVTTLGRRRGHRETEARYASGGEIGPIPVRQRFEVRDYSRTGSTEFLTLGRRIQPRAGRVAGQRVIRVRPYQRRGRLIVDRMLFPRDPEGSAGNVVNCTCLSEEVVPDFEIAARRAGGELT